MQASPFTDDELLAYLDEMLPVERAAALEAALRSSVDLTQKVSQLIRRRDQGGHTVGEIWRRQRLSCPTRSELGSLLLGTADEAEKTYIEFHLRTIGCRVCLANLDDLQASQSADSEAPLRRQRFFESSAGTLRHQRDDIDIRQ
ncbi:MAG: hypothetical protein R3C01_14755 [Planctomycetaceae bacterium]